MDAEASKRLLKNMGIPEMINRMGTPGAGEPVYLRSERKHQGIGQEILMERYKLAA